MAETGKAKASLSGGSGIIKSEAKADDAQSKAKPKTKAKAKAKAHTVRKAKPKATSGVEAGQLDRIPAKQPRW